jgi:hypothetical protein
MARSYLFAIAVDVDRQSAIDKCVIGERVQIVACPGENRESTILEVMSVHGDVIGYVPRNSWLERAVLKKESKCDAIIMGVKRPSRAPISVVLDIRIVAKSRSTTSYDLRDWIKRLLNTDSQPPSNPWSN